MKASSFKDSLVEQRKREGQTGVIITTEALPGAGQYRNGNSMEINIGSKRRRYCN